MPDIHALHAGDEAEWNLAFEILWPDAFHVARRRLPSWTSADAEDCAVVAIRDAAACVGRVGTFEELRALVRWMAHRRAIDLHRRLYPTRLPEESGSETGVGGGSEGTPAGDGPQGTTIADPEPEPWERADAVELARWLREATCRLSPIEKALLAGHYAEGKSHAELAHALGVGRATIGVRIHRALAKARNLLAARPALFRELHARCVSP